MIVDELDAGPLTGLGEGADEPPGVSLMVAGHENPAPDPRAEQRLETAAVGGTAPGGGEAELDLEPM